MLFFRRVLGRIALACLFSHMATLAVVPTVLLVHSGAGALECTCSHGDHAICPMHHRSASGCAMRSPADLAVALIPALFGLSGAMPGADARLLPPADGVALVPITASPVRLTTPPDLPPPRS
jgi:hypothetical protein